MTDKSHLLRFGYAPGNYWFVCPDCGDKQAVGDKRATRCEACAETLYSQVSSVEAVADKHRAMTTLPEEAVKAAENALMENRWLVPGPAIELILTAALPHLPQGVGVKELEWRQEENGDFIAESIVGWYHIGLPHRMWNLTKPIGEVLSFWTLDEARASAQADYDARILSALEPSAARELALEEACKLVERRINMVPSDTKAFRAYQDACRHILGDLRALSSPDHADAGKVEGDGWLPIESAPKDGTEILGWHKVAGPAQTRFYDGEWCCVDWNEDQYIACTWEPSRWRPLPSAPSQEVAGS